MVETRIKLGSKEVRVGYDFKRKCQPQMEMMMANVFPFYVA